VTKKITRESAKTYQGVRSLGRGLKILETLSKLGWAKPAAVADSSDLDRSSTYRLMNTLLELGYVVRRSEDGAFALTRKVKGIAAGIRDDDVVLMIVGRNLAELVHQVKWPSDFARFSHGRIAIEESTHSLSPVTFHRGTIGQERSFLKSALGLAILSVLRPDEITSVYEIAQKLDPTANDDKLTDRIVASVLKRVQRLGYASAIGTIDSKVSAIAVPFRCGETVGAVNIVFFRKVLSPSEAANRFLEPLQKCVERIRAEIVTFQESSSQPNSRDVL
jgi:IclR family transcriptional regulator, mhp operon transcriptional activator